MQKPIHRVNVWSLYPDKDKNKYNQGLQGVCYLRFAGVKVSPIILFWLKLLQVINLFP